MHDECEWTPDSVGDALEALCRSQKWPTADIGRPPWHIDAVLGQFVLDNATAVGCEVAEVTIPYDQLDRALATIGTSLVFDSSRSRFLVVLTTTRRHAHVLRSDRGVARVSLGHVRNFMAGDYERLHADEMDTLLSPTIGREQRAALSSAIVADYAVSGVWLVTPRTEDSWSYARHRGTIGKAIQFLLASAADALLWTGSWWILGLIAFNHSHTGLLALWGTIVATMVAARALAASTSRAVAADLGVLLKKRLLLGALKLTPDEVQGNGAGTYLSHVLEAATVETFAGAAVVGTVSAAITSVVAVAVIASGAGGWPHSILFALWLGTVFAVTARYAKARQEWTDARYKLTSRVVEDLTGHKTLLAQRSPNSRCLEEDRLLERHIVAERTLNRQALRLELLRKTWPWAGLLSLTPVVLVDGATTTALSIAAGGVLLGAQALSSWVDSSANLAAVAVAASRVRSFWYAARRRSGIGDLQLRTAARTQPEGIPVVQAHGVTYRHANHNTVALDNVHLSIRADDRILLTGPSGSGKSTLAAVLSTVRESQTGLLFYRGMDVASVGLENWRRSVLLTPQFHLNHIFIGPLAYNLLLGRTWPPTARDLHDATAICDELGLSPLMERMPLGIFQPVGEAGWQLSHGERARVCLARALLQEPELLILDETVAALDPETLQQCMRVATVRAKALLVIEHQ